MGRWVALMDLGMGMTWKGERERNRIKRLITWSVWIKYLYFHPNCEYRWEMMDRVKGKLEVDRMRYAFYSVYFKPFKRHVEWECIYK
jgi:hypothetical protein